ncbi:MAG: hypothetical protein NTY41_10175 [Proteobacteria bacterium]|nr:hypothetical protein [Pseudomonadota bacterium]
MLAELSTRRNGAAVPSLTMLAVTPRLAALIASRMPPRELLAPSMVTVLVPELLLVKDAPLYLPVTGSGAAPAMVPNSKL